MICSFFWQAMLVKALQKSLSKVKSGFENGPATDILCPYRPKIIGAQLWSLSMVLAICYVIRWRVWSIKKLTDYVDNGEKKSCWRGCWGMFIPRQSIPFSQEGAFNEKRYVDSRCRRLCQFRT